MTILMITFAVFLFFGLFFVMADLLKIPHLRTTQAIINTKRTDKKLTKTIEAWLMEISLRISKYIPIDEYKYSRLKNILKASGIAMTPEVYTAYAYVKAGCIILCALPCLLVLPLLAPVFVLLGIAVYFKESGKADETLRAKREEIESELPRFAATVEQELKNSRDVLSILENFKKNAGENFAHELNITCADMRSGSYEAALTRFESRLNSPQLSDIVRGLIGVLRGDDGGLYFQMLSHDFKLIELGKLKAAAQKIPPKIRIFSFIMLFCFTMTFLAIMIMEILNSLGTMF